MGRGNLGASTSLAALEPQDDLRERKRRREGWRVDRETSPLVVLPSDWKENKLRGKKEVRTRLDIKRPGVEMKFPLGALSALLCCLSSSSHTLDPAGKNVCRSIR
ncbi:putative scavenger receptor class F member 1-like [Scophthalmus maximus]|uniref:Putative scavenger receptor class F member 1-like n=1 Tax=Scophthalmus maximus TaxID=52904 RepID=A0A2U9B558_SCOMX|nr:putative scavenger receptor class F member 1-like [Scophthalmus maximus]